MGHLYFSSPDDNKIPDVIISGKKKHCLHILPTLIKVNILLYSKISKHAQWFTMTSFKYGEPAQKKREDLDR